ncbi:MAG: nicotinate-nucleotide adenylyltransferase [Chloroflexota bacterium]
MRVGILGGTFDPIHYGHLVAAEECLHRLKLERVVVMPAGQPPHKRGRLISPAVDRLAMVELAVAGNPRFVVSTLELEREGPSYTVDTLALLREQLGTEVELFFIIGLDAVLELLTWHQPRRILQLCTLAAVSRPGFAFDVGPLLSLLPEAAERIVHVPAPRMEIASSDLRARVASGWPIRYQLPEEVEAYIRAHGLYLNGSAAAK